MPYYDITNLVTVTKMNMIRQNSSWLGKNHCGENIYRSCAADLAVLEVSYRAAQGSQFLCKSSADQCRGLKSSKI